MGLSAFFEVQTSKLLSFFRNIFNSASCIRPIHSLAAFILLYNMFYLIPKTKKLVAIKNVHLVQLPLASTQARNFVVTKQPEN
jgi:hypothetical protein